MRALYLLVFTAGLVTLGMELSAARLLEPAFGNSQIVWAALIGLILLSLAIGAWLGGSLADRFPRRRALDLTLTAGALGVALVPLLSAPVLRLASQGLADFAPGLLAGALLAVGLLFAVPAVLLGTATPWAVRLAVGEEWSMVNGQRSMVNASSGSVHAQPGIDHAPQRSVDESQGIDHAGRGSVHASSGSVHASSGIDHAPQRSVDESQGIDHARQGSVHASSGSVHAQQGSVHASSGSVPAQQRSVHAWQGSVHAREGIDHAEQRSVPAQQAMVHEQQGMTEEQWSMANGQRSTVNDSPQSPVANLQSPISNLGHTAGRLSATATAGSLVGAFLPVLWLIPAFGTRWTFYLLALLLLGVLSVGALRQPHRWAPLAALVLVLVLAFFTQPQGVRAAWDDGRTGTLIYEDESAVNYIAVRQWGSERHLKLNDGIGIHSVYHPGALLSQGIWDYFLLAPLFRSSEGRGARGGETTIVDCQLLIANEECASQSPHLPISPSPISNLQSPISNLLLIGAAAGTVPGLYTEIYGSVPITGVELDPQILAVGRDYFGATWPNYTQVAADGRRWLAQQPDDAHFDVIAVDAYRPPYIPFHLTTVEFFELVRDHLAEDGVVAVNVGRTDTNYALVDAMTATMAQVFPSVFVVDEPGPPGTLANSLVVATRQPATLDTFLSNAAALSTGYPEEFRAFVARAATQARVAQPPASAPIFTDDHSQVEQVVHGLIVDFLTHQ